MIVTFRTKAYADIVMFGDVAKELLKLAGHSGTVPSAIPAEEVHLAISRLESGLAQRLVHPPESDARSSGEEDEAEVPIPLARRAFPLLQLLRAADAAGADVMIQGSN